MLNQRTTLLTMFAVTCLSACSVLPVAKNHSASPKAVQPEHVAEPLELIATDFISAYGQLPDFLAANTTVDMQRSGLEDEFTQAVATALQRAHYGVRWIGDEHTKTTSLFQYRKVSDKAPAGATSDTYEVAIGIVEMRRSYALRSNLSVLPISPLYMRGVDSTGVVLNEQLFAQPPKDEQLVSRQPRSAPDISARQQAVHVKKTPSQQRTFISQQANSSLPTGAIPTGAIPSTAVRSVASDANALKLMPQPTSERSPAAQTRGNMPFEENMFDLGGSNFQDLLTDRVVVNEQILVFGNDSLRLGARNKRLVEKMVEQFDPRRDVFSVIGCSMGPTQVKGGNAALALGRAGRVVEALRYAGVANQYILDEVCWSVSGSDDRLPHRGVVLSLNRKS